MAVGERGLGGRGVGERADDACAPRASARREHGVDEAGAARARRAWPARPTRRRRRARARGRERSAGRPRGAARPAPADRAWRRAGRPAARSRGRAWRRAGRSRSSAAWRARDRARPGRRRRASPCSARSAQASCSNTRRTTAYAHARAGATEFWGHDSMVRPARAMRAFTRAWSSDWLPSALAPRLRACQYRGPFSGLILKVRKRLFAAVSTHARTFVQNSTPRLNLSQEG